MVIVVTLAVVWATFLAGLLAVRFDAWITRAHDRTEDQAESRRVVPTSLLVAAGVAATETLRVMRWGLILWAVLRERVEGSVIILALLTLLALWLLDALTSYGAVGLPMICGDRDLSRGSEDGGRRDGRPGRDRERRQLMSSIEERAIAEYVEEYRRWAEERAARCVRAVQNKLGVEAQPTPEGFARVDNLLFWVSFDCTMRVRRDDWPAGAWRVIEDWASLGAALSDVPKPAEKAPASATLVLERIASVLEMVANSIIVKVN